MCQKLFSNSIKNDPPGSHISESFQGFERNISYWIEIRDFSLNANVYSRKRKWFWCLRSYPEIWNFLTRWKIITYLWLMNNLKWNMMHHIKVISKHNLTNCNKSHHRSDALGSIYFSMHPVLHKIAIHLSIQKTRRIYNVK